MASRFEVERTTVIPIDCRCWLPARHQLLDMFQEMLSDSDEVWYVPNPRYNAEEAAISEDFDWNAGPHWAPDAEPGALD